MKIDMNIKIGNLEGNYFTQWRLDELSNLANELNDIIPEATDWSLWYDSYNDYHCLEFNFGGHHYKIQYYKIFTICRDGNETYSGEFAKMNFGRTTNGIISLFKSGRHINWMYDA